MARRPDALIYAVGETPPLATTLFLGLQQVALMAIYLVMVVIVVRQAGRVGASRAERGQHGPDRDGDLRGTAGDPERSDRFGILGAAGDSAIYLAPS